jgi:hypothetical protein
MTAVRARLTFLEFPEAREEARARHSEPGCSHVLSWSCPECGTLVEGRCADMAWRERVGGLCRPCLLGEDYDDLGD